MSVLSYMSVEEQVDADFSRARRRAVLRHVRTHLRRDAARDGLLCFDDVRKIPGAVGRICRGMRTVPVSQIGGSVGRCLQFDRDFLPLKPRVEERWKHIDRAFHRGEELPPVSLYKVGGFYFVLDGHHRISVAYYHGVEWIDAHVTEFNSRLWSNPRDKDGLIEPSKVRGESRMRKIMDLQLAHQRREERLREVDVNRRAKALRSTREQRASQRSALVREIKRHAARLLKLLRIQRKAGEDCRTSHLSEKNACVYAPPQGLSARTCQAMASARAAEGV